MPDNNPAVVSRMEAGGRRSTRRRVRDPSWPHWFLMKRSEREKKEASGDVGLRVTSDVTHTHTPLPTHRITHTSHTPSTSTWQFIVFPVSHHCPTILQSSHNRKLKERVAAPGAPPLFDLCESLSLMKISEALRTTGAADRGATCSPHNSQRLPTSERCNRPAGEEGEDGGGGGRGPTDGCRLHTNRQV